MHRYFYKLKTIGVKRFWKIAQNRFIAYQFIRKKRDKSELSYSILYPTKKILFELGECTEQLLYKADLYANGIFEYLGAPAQCYTKVPWYEDVRLPKSQQDRFFDATSFYTDIKIPYNADADEVHKDIKVPWELGRFQYAPILACAYMQTHQEKYAHALKKYISSWIQSAPYLHGIHWLNPMEVAIRAVNWIIAWQYMGAYLEQDIEFFNNVVVCLQQHFEYIEHRWEWYDGRTNNHYLSNLVGYAYVCWFFEDKHKWQWCYKEIKNELAWQIFDEGTSYEGSTAYHGLVTELFLHALYVAQHMGEKIDSKMIAKLERMVLFWHQTRNLTIGDEDGGRLCDSDAVNDKKIMDRLGLKNYNGEPNIYKNFGIAFLKRESWNISMRVQSYHARQPSAHFHEDIGSITLSYKGIRILVDPGTFVYSGSHLQRNIFRSAQNHSTFYPLDRGFELRDPFYLPMAEGKATTVVSPNSIMSEYNVYGYQAKRAISIQEDVCTITDSFDTCVSWIWRLVFHPEITLHKIDQHWIIQHRGIPILKCDAPDHTFVPLKSAYSHSYGMKESTQLLSGTAISGKNSTQIYLRSL